MAHILPPLRKIIAEYAAEFEFVDFDPVFQKVMSLDAVHKKPDFMRLLRENPGRIIHGVFRDVDYGESAGDKRWIVEPLEDHKWSILPEMPSWEYIRQISDYCICICTTANGYALLEKNPTHIKWVNVHLFKHPASEIDLLVLGDQNDVVLPGAHITGLDNVYVHTIDKKFTAKFVPVIPEDIKRAIQIE